MRPTGTDDAGGRSIERLDESDLDGLSDLADARGWGSTPDGPMAATDDADALGVLATLVEVARAEGAEEFRIDLATVQVGLRAWCSARGLPEIRTAPGLMLRAEGEATSPSPARRALITQGFG